ncbi:MAG: NAD(P)/FAD-dependent oxidoreductase [Patescibacteria group bacterium]|nr:NAD(P)/FAD-dependent oxidoreductase [Patescibacteria group bacterium]
MKYDVVVIGGGPAGMMCAGRASELGSRVLLLEKNRYLGVKLLITGKGRCNITNKIDDLKEITSKFGKNGKFLFSSFYKFGVEDTINFFESRGVKTKIERGNRVFPVSDQSKDVLDSLIGYLKKSQVALRTSMPVKDIIKSGNRIEKVVLVSGEEIFADKFVICTGGKSYPGTGSSGDGYNWLTKLGHTITSLSPSLTPIVVKEEIVKELEGLSLKNIEISIYKNNKKINSRFGEAIFTADGISGPVILDLSNEIGKHLSVQMKIQIDFKPALDFAKLDLRIQKDFRVGNNKIFRNSLDRLLPQKLIPVMIKLSGIDSKKKVNLVTKEERKKLLHLIKEFSLEFKSLKGYERAIATSGGVDLREIDPLTMKSTLIDNLYFAGEILDLDGPTGGYNLQLCWSTGFVAGENVVK